MRNKKRFLGFQTYPVAQHRLAHIGVLIIFIASICTSTGCNEKTLQFPASRASKEVTNISQRWEKAIYKLDAAALMGLFQDTCLFECHGFRFQEREKMWGGNLVRFKWTKRDRTGTLAGDLAGHLDSFQKIQRADITLSKLEFMGSRVAKTRIKISVDGILITGHRRSDRGSIDLILKKRGASGQWAITQYNIEDMETLVSNELGFRPRSDLVRPDERTPQPVVIAGKEPPKKIETAKDDAKTAIFNDIESKETFLLTSSNGSINIWSKSSDDSFRLVQTLTIKGSEITEIKHIDITNNGRPEIIVATRNNGIHYFEKNTKPLPKMTTGSISQETQKSSQTTRRSETSDYPPFSSKAKHLPFSAFPDHKDICLSTLAAIKAFGDEKTGHLGFYLAFDRNKKSPQNAKNMKACAPNGDLILIKKGKHFKIVNEVVFEPLNGPKGQTKGLCIANSPLKQVPNPASGNKFNPPSFLKITDRASWIISHRHRPPTFQANLISRSWSTGCLVTDLDNDQNSEWLISGFHNKWPWVYERTDFPLPWKRLLSHKKWRTKIRQGCKGTTIFSPVVKHNSSPRLHSKTETSLYHHLSGYSGLVTAPKGVDLDGDGFLEIVAVMKGSSAGRESLWSFWVRDFPLLWDSDRRLRVAKSIHKSSDALIFLKKNSDGTYSDLSYVIGWINPDDKIKSFSFGNIIGHGAMDMMVLKGDGTVTLWANELPQQNTLTIKIRGTPENPSAVGARVEVTTKEGGLITKRLLNGLDGGNKRIGVGGALRVRVTVSWPGGKSRTWEDLATETPHVLETP